MVDTLHRPEVRERKPLIPPPQGFGPPRMRFGVPEIVTAVCGVAAVVGGMLAWISFGARPDQTGLDVPFMFLFRGFDAADSAFSLGLIVMILGAIGLMSSAGLATAVFRAVAVACGLMIFAAAAGTVIQIDLSGSVAVGTTTLEAIGIGAWISGASGLLMFVTSLLWRFE